MAAGPITFTEMWAFREMTGADLSGWEVQLIRRLDATAMRIMSMQADGTLPHPGAPTLKEILRGKVAERRAIDQAKADAAAQREARAAAAAPTPPPVEATPSPAPRRRRHARGATTAAEE